MLVGGEKGEGGRVALRGVGRGGGGVGWLGNTAVFLSHDSVGTFKQHVWNCDEDLRLSDVAVRRF